MEKQELKPGDVVQLNPEFHFGDKNGFFGACFMTVTEPKDFGAQGFICIPTKRGEEPGKAYYRAKWEEMEFIGEAVWVSAPEGKED